MIKVVYLYNLKAEADSAEFERYYFNERIDQVMVLPELLQFTFSRLAGENQAYRYMAECYFADMATAQRVLNSEAFKNVHGYIADKITDKQVLFYDTYAWKPAEYGQKQPKWIKVADTPAFVPPLHSKSFAWSMIDKESVGVENVSISVSEIQPGGTAEMDVHPESDQYFFVLSGRGKTILAGREFFMEPNGCLFIPRNSPHAMEVIGQETLRALVVFAPALT